MMVTKKKKNPYGVFPKEVWRYHIFPYFRSRHCVNKQSLMIAFGLRPTVRKLDYYLIGFELLLFSSYTIPLLRQIASINEVYPLKINCSEEILREFFQRLAFHMTDGEDWVKLKAILSEKRCLNFLRDSAMRSFGNYQHRMNEFCRQFTKNLDLVFLDLEDDSIVFIIQKYKNVNLFKYLYNQSYRSINCIYILHALLKETKKEIVDQKRDKPCLELQQMLTFFFNMDIMQRQKSVTFLFDKSNSFNDDDFDRMLRFFRICGVIPDFSWYFNLANMKQLQSYVDCDGIFPRESCHLKELLHNKNAIFVLNYCKSQGKSLHYLNEFGCFFWLDVFSSNFNDEEMATVVQLFQDLGVKKNALTFHTLVTSDHVKEKERIKVIDKLILFEFPMQLMTSDKEYIVSFKKEKKN